MILIVHVQVDEVVQKMTKNGSDTGNCRGVSGSSVRPQQIRASASWLQRSAIIFFCIHPHLGGGNREMTATMLNINYSTALSSRSCLIFFMLTFYLSDTLKCWLNKPAYIELWIPFVSVMTLGQAVSAMPKHSQHHFSHLDRESKLTDASLARYQLIVVRKYRFQP